MFTLRSIQRIYSFTSFIQYTQLKKFQKVAEAATKLICLFIRP